MPESLGAVLAYTGVSAETAGTIGGAVAVAGPTVAGAVASAGANALLAPKPPKIGDPIAMPDAQAQELARRNALAEQVARRGRASTVLTQGPTSQTLGG